MQTIMSRHNQNRRSSGFTLIEVLIAFVVMAAGLLALLSFHNSTQTNAAEAKMQAEATSLADGKLQELSSYLTSTDVRLNETNCDTVSESVSGQLTDFTLCWEIENDDDYPNQKMARVSVSWTDRNGDAQDVALSSEVNFRRPTEGAENLLRLVHANSSTNAGGSWESGNGQQDQDNSDDQTDNGNDGQDNTDNDGNGDPDQSPATYACECQYKNNSGYTLESGGGCCSVSGCESAVESVVDNPPPQNNTQWEYTCVVR